MMKKLKLSPWHDGSVKPVHVGVYERNVTESGPLYSLWDGKNWMTSCVNRSLAEKQRYKSAFQSELEWRGIIKEET